MQLETIRHSMFALTTTESATIVGGNKLAPADSFENQDTFYLDGSVRTDKAQID